MAGEIIIEARIEEGIEIVKSGGSAPLNESSIVHEEKPRNLSEALVQEMRGGNMFLGGGYGKKGTLTDEMYDMSPENRQEYLKNLDIAWVERNGQFYVSERPNVESLPSGYYSLGSSMQTGPFLKKEYPVIDELFYFPDPTIDDMIKDIRKFWDSEKKYREYGFVYKRGILLWGPPGTGKTSVINLFVQEILENHDGIVLNVNDIYLYGTMSKIVRTLEPKKPILAIMEDLDGMMVRHDPQFVLNLLNGADQVDNVVYIATTNYLERLEERIKNRPSRFDRLYMIGNPDERVRDFYLKRVIKPDDVSRFNINIPQWVKDTDGLTISHIKELILSVVILENDYKESLERLRKMSNLDMNPQSTSYYGY